MQVRLLFLSMIVLPVCSFSQTLKDLPITKLEEGFWSCDYVSTQTLLNAGDAASCSAIFEELKTRKFGGNFQLFMDWWNTNKVAEYRKLKAKGN